MTSASLSWQRLSSEDFEELEESGGAARGLADLEDEGFGPTGREELHPKNGNLKKIPLGKVKIAQIKSSKKMAKCEVSLDVDESVRFHPIDAQVARGQDVTVRYTVGERFRPKSGDWIGLFRVNGSGRTEHEYIGFCWARKYSSWKEGPLDRNVDFRISDFKIPVDDFNLTILVYCLLEWSRPYWATKWGLEIVQVD